VLPHERGELESQIRTLLREANAESWVQLEVGDLHRSLARARGAAFSVSGTVLIDLVHHRLPTVVVYRLGNGRQAWLAQHVLTAPWFASPNLLAGREVFPEFCFAGDGPTGEIDAALERALSDPSWRRSVRLALDGVAARLGPAGACRRAARAVLAAAGGRR
jgi:lipid A disaccharide synthetase